METIRYYQRRGLLPEPDRPLRGVRRYDEDHLGQAHFIRRAKAVGFTLSEIEALLVVRENSACEETRGLVRRKLDRVEARLRELQGFRHELKAWLARCDENDAGLPCPALEELDRPPAA